MKPDKCIYFKLIKTSKNVDQISGPRSLKPFYTFVRGCLGMCVFFAQGGGGEGGEGVYKEVDGDVNMEDEQIGRKVNKVDDEGRRGNLSPKRPTRFFVI